MEAYVKHQLTLGHHNVLTEIPLRVLLSFDYASYESIDKTAIVQILIARCTRERVQHIFDWTYCRELIDEYILTVELPLEDLKAIPVNICSAKTIARRYIASQAFPDYSQYLKWGFEQDDTYPREFNLHIYSMHLRQQNERLRECVRGLESRVNDLTDMFKYYLGSDEYLLAEAEFAAFTAANSPRENKEDK